MYEPVNLFTFFFTYVGLLAIVMVILYTLKFLIWKTPLSRHTKIIIMMSLAFALITALQASMGLIR
ncbi:hypothetical protein COA18_04390 [Priestia megaterium]|nr:hypothetical protein COA18_04390 [Priestia megaterium]